MYAARMFVVYSSLVLVWLFVVTARATAQEPEACGADLTNFVLPCFEAYKTDLRPFHYTEIDNMAEAIANHVRESGQRVETVAVYGYGVFFKPDDPVIHNSQQRAENVTAALNEKLRNRGLQLRRRQFVAVGIGDPAPASETETQDQRWLARRVEVSVTYADEKAQKKNRNKDCEPDEQMVSRLGSFDKNYSNEGRELAVRCMSKLLTQHYSCKASNNSDYFHTASTTVAYTTGFVERFENGRKPFGDFACGGKKGEALKNCLGRLDADLLQGIDTLNRIIVRDSIEAQRSHVPVFAECKVGRWILNQYETNKGSPYTCYPTQAKAFEVCRE